MKTAILLLLLTVSITAQVEFSRYFEPKTLRIDYFHSGTDTSGSYSMDELRQEPYWGGSLKNLIDTFQYGKYMFMAFDSASNKLIYSRGFSTLFSEWQTTAEAKKTAKTFSETVTMPFPKKTVRIAFYDRDKTQKFQKRFEYYVNPSSYFISPEIHRQCATFEVLKSGGPETKVDLVIIPEGYTKEDMQKFRNDCQRFAGYLFNASPYKENKEKFNIWGVEAFSEESGTDIPAKNIWKKTALNTTFFTFDLERYLMTSDNKSVRDLASNVPYDQIYILANTSEYGGGAIYNHYSVCVSDNKYDEYIFTHEFGHGFAGLGDEYYTSDVAYENFYPEGIEPWEPNLTTLVNFESKWKNMVAVSVPVPTPPEKKYEKTVGVFEGGGYVAKGVFRPRQDCTMKSISVNNFCPVCQKAIEKMINFYSE